MVVLVVVVAVVVVVVVGSVVAVVDPAAAVGGWTVVVVEGGGRCRAGAGDDVHPAVIAIASRAAETAATPEGVRGERHRGDGRRVMGMAL